MIRILHIVTDDKFFDLVITHFEKDNRLENKCVLLVKQSNYSYKYIKSTDKITLLWNKKMLKDQLKSDEYDVVFFHSLPEKRYNLFKYIPEEKIVIWWTWGYDIYESSYGLKPLLSIELYKDHTKQFVSERKNRILDKIKKIIKTHFLKVKYGILRENILKRIDYFQPVIPTEYKLILENNDFHAKEFYYYNSEVKAEIVDGNVLKKAATGAILIGNSASYTNNHLDVWEYIKQLKPKDHKIIFPLNYGDVQYANYLKTVIKSEDNELIFLNAFMPRDEYFSLLNECSYAIFGVMRQQAMGNISYCIRNGIKVFLFCDSLVYKYLKKEGYSVFCIENMDYESLNTPLAREEIEKNIKLSNLDVIRRNQIYEKCLLEMSSKIVK